jgi:hypothetical protein
LEFDVMDMTRALPALFAAAVVLSLPATASAQWSPSLPVIIVNPSPFGGWGPGLAAPAWGWGWPYDCNPTYSYSTGWSYPACYGPLTPTYSYATGWSYPGYGVYPGYGYGTGPAYGYYGYQPGVRRDWR